MATTRTKAENAVEEKTAEFDLEKFEYLIVKGTVEKDGKTLVHCKLPKEANLEERIFGLNGDIKRIQLGQWIDISYEWAEFIEECLRDIERLSVENRKILDKFSEQ